MTGQIIIENLRNISRLQFTLPRPGVWLLTAGNGAGKTSLLACLRRIGWANAFPFHFPYSQKSANLDNYDEALIKYAINGKEVEYAYRGERWAPRPRNNSHLLQEFGYPSVMYIGATPDRITPRPEDFELRRVRKAPAPLIAAANRIFETQKFNELHTINITAGAGNNLFLLKVGDRKSHSEKQFSLGELCVLKLLRLISDCPNNSLLLIDELEIALHPRAQIQLVDYLSDASRRKSLTVLFSTHSVSIMKSVSRNQIIYLERNDDNVVEPLIGCFPTYAIGQITIGEERIPDVVFYVEDDVARVLVKSLAKLVMSRKYNDTFSLFPSLKVVPIGGFENVVRFLKQHTVLLPNHVKAFALLDEEVQSETLARWTQAGSFQRLSLFEALRSKIDYLPWTPEVAIVSYFNENRSNVERDLQQVFADSQIRLRANLFSSLVGLTGVTLRTSSKDIFKKITKMIADCTARTIDAVEASLCEYFAKEFYRTNNRAVMQLLAPKLT